ncbi:GH116 family glycosyl-hydrolase [Actinoplanes sp. CA-054009]
MNVIHLTIEQRTAAFHRHRNLDEGSKMMRTLPIRQGSRRFLTAGLSLLVVATGLSVTSPAQASPSSRDYFRVPSAATTRALGDIAEGTCPQGYLPYACKEPSPGFPYPGVTFPLSVPGLGVPLGGIGAGNFMVNQSGTFGPWFFGGSQSDSWEARALPQAAFHVREKFGSSPAQVRTLATDGPHREDYKGDPLEERSWEDPLPAWNALGVGDADYAALYPFGWMSYKPFKTDISMRFYSPIVAKEDRRSSLPVAYFDVRIANHTNRTADVSTMFTMPNVAGHQGRQPATVREGLRGKYRMDSANHIAAVTLSADGTANTPDAKNSEWTIAAAVGKGQSVSYTTSWNASGDGSDVYAPFSARGSLPDRALDSTASAGAIAVSAKLKPGETTTIPFVMSWDFPQVAFADNNTVWMRRYTNFYGARTTPRNDYIAGSYPFHQSFAMAKDALVDRAKNLADVQKWWNPIAYSTAYPDWLKEAALNQLGNVAFHTSVWEGGLVSNSVPVISGGSRIGTSLPGTHNYLGLDSNAGGLSTLGQGGEIGIYSYEVYSDLFPSIERDRMRGKVEAIMSPTSYGDPADFGMTGSTSAASYTAEGDPFITWSQGTEAGPGQAWFLDRPAENVFRMYDYAERNHDRAFLKFAYPAMKKTFGYLQATIPSGHALPEVPSANHPDPGLKSPFPMSNVYNGIPSNRFDAYVSGLYILAAESMIAAGERMKESPAEITRLKGQVAAARAEFEELFWNADGGYYRYTPPEGSAPDNAMLATFLSQYLAQRAGLPDVVDQNHYRSHLKVMHGFVTGTKDSAGRPSGATLLGTATNRSGDVWPHANYSAAANYVLAGKRFNDTSLIRQGLDMGSVAAKQLWDVKENGYAFNAPISYDPADPGSFLYPSFESNLAAWQIVDVLKNNRSYNMGRPK